MAVTSRFALRRAAATQSSAASRALHTSRVARAAPSSSAATEEYPPETFGAPIWRYTAATLLLGYGLYKGSAVYNAPGPSPATATGLAVHDKEVEEPWMTRYLANWTTSSSVWRDISAKHLELVKDQAEQRLLFQEAERSPIHRLRYTQTFEQASPHNVIVGSQADLSDLNVKRATE